MSHIKRSAASICALSLLAAIGCSPTQHTVEPPVEIAPFTVPTSAPRPEADEPIERFVARWNAWVDSVPEDQRVGDAVERAKDRMNKKLSKMSNVDEGFDAIDMMGLAKPGGYFWEEAGRIYESIAPELDLMRELVQREAIAIHIDLDSDEGEDASSLFDWYSWSANDAAHVLGYRVRYLVLAGRAQESVGDIRAIFDTERLIRESPSLLGWLGAGAIRDLAWNTLNKALVIDPDAYTDEQLAEFQDRMADWVDEDMAPIIKAEEYFEILQLRDLYSDSVDGKLSEESSRYILEFYASTANMSKVLDRSIVFGYNPTKKRTKIEFAPLDQQIAMLKASNDAFIADAKAYPPMVIESHLSRLANDLRTNHDAVSFLPSLQLASIYGLLLSNNVVLDIEVRATVIVLAIHRHRLATGDWPESLEDISFEHLRVDPIDMHTGELLNYAMISGEPLLWSGGPDRDNDGGFAVESYMKQWPTEPYGEYLTNPVRSWFTLDEWDAMSEEDQAKYDGDWILFPPDKSDLWDNDEY